MADIDAPELTPPDKLFAPKGSFLAGERIIDDDTPYNPPSNPALAAGLQRKAAQLGGQTDADLELPQGLQQDLATQKRQQYNERLRTEGVATDQMNADRQRYVRAYNAEGIGPNDLQPFNVKETERQTQHSPLEAFGSLGSVFAMVASAFTHQPMTNSLNAGAAALNAVKAGDDKEFERHYNEWKDNTNLALKRQAIQHEMYTDAISLAGTDLRSAEVKFKMQASRFGDQNALLMMERYGLASKEMIDYVEGTNKAAEGTAKAHAAIVADHGLAFTEAAFKSDAGSRSDDPQTRFQTWQKYFGKPEPALQQALAAKTREKEQAGEGPLTSDDIIKVNREMQRITSGAGGSTNLTVDRQVAQAAASKKAELISQGIPEEKATQAAMAYASQLRRTASAPSGNQLDNLRSLKDRAGIMKETIGKMEELLAKHKALTGLGGTVTRPYEIVENWFRGDETDRAQFARYVSEVQEWGSRVLNELKGRPLSAEVSRLDKILPGLSRGDTTANVVRAYRELVPLLTQIQQQLDARMKGPQAPASNTSTQGVDAETSKDTGAWWLAAPKVNQ